jgi:hypothetical protein
MSTARREDDENNQIKRDGIREQGERRGEKTGIGDV